MKPGVDTEVERPRIYTSLQLGRAIAAVAVLLFHLSANIQLPKYFGVALLPVPFGAAGVEFFFVLSGFIIYTAHASDIGRPTRLGNYLWRRFSRIYPTYWICLAGMTALMLSATSTRASIPTSLAIWIKTLLLLPQDPHVVGGTGAPVLIVAWTLTYEVAFYLAFAAAIVSQRLGIFLTAGVLLLWLACRGNKDLMFLLSFATRDYVALFLLGVLAGATNRRWLLGPGASATLLSLGSLGLLILAICSYYQSPDLTLQWGLAFTSLILGLCGVENLGFAVRDQRLLLLGDSSYAMYLLHFPIVSIACKVVVAIGLLGVSGAMLTWILAVVATFAASVSFHVWLERPVTAALTRRRATRDATSTLPDTRRGKF